MIASAHLDLAALERTGDETLVRLVHRALTHPYYSFQPRPDDPANFDEQAGFVGSDALVSFVVGGNGSGKTFCAAVKAAQFLLEKQPPPAKDTPFWVIANTYEQVCQSAWFQKLRTILPEEAVDRRRITWKNANREWPYSVPLKPWPGRPGKNWMLEFKSYEQGRESMQATAIGGAWFTEQFPWEVFEEVFRGCREYMLPGSVFADFTPIDPEKSAEVESAYEQWLAGESGFENWAFFRMNTEAAVDAGHASRTWYDTFFSMVSEEMQETRKTGAFATYEGTIFQSFSPKIHLLPQDWPRDAEGFIKIPPGVWHRRGIDWGASAEHPFVCLWAYKNSVGQYFFYDEYWNDSQMVTALDHIDEIRGRHGWPNSPYYGSTFADPSRPDQITLFGARGIPITPARNAVHEGIECVRRHLKIHEGMGEPMLFIDPVKCPVLARQMRTYRWLRSPRSMRSVNPQVARPEPLKRDDDAVDAARYLLFSDATQGTGKITARQVRSDSARHGVRLHGRK